MLIVEVLRLSRSAAIDDSEVTRSTKLAQSTRLSIATSGSTTKSTPAAAGTKTQPGRPTLAVLALHDQGLPKPASARTCRPASPVTRSTNSWARSGWSLPLTTAIG